MTVLEIIDEFNRGNIRILTKDEEIEIFNYLYSHPEEKETIQTILILANKGLVIEICKKYSYNINVDFDDLMQFGNMGLLKAIEKFDITKNTKFSSYATFWIRETISRELEKNVNETGYPFKVNEIKRKYYYTKEHMEKRLKRVVTLDEVANVMNIKPSELKETLQLASNNIISLNDTIDDKEMLELINIDDLSSTDEERSELIIDALNELNEKEKSVILYRYGYVDGYFHTLEETAKYLNVTRQRIQQIEKEAISAMKLYIKKKKS